MSHSGALKWVSGLDEQGNMFWGGSDMSRAAEAKAGDTHLASDSIESLDEMSAKVGSGEGWGSGWKA